MAHSVTFQHAKKVFVNELWPRLKLKVLHMVGAAPNRRAEVFGLYRDFLRIIPRAIRVGDYHLVAKQVYNSKSQPMLSDFELDNPLVVQFLMRQQVKKRFVLNRTVTDPHTIDQLIKRGRADLSLVRGGGLVQLLRRDDWKGTKG
eukprot:gnl/Spiro4/4815_TR2410_c0_g1_i1.p2 gnl/Spiro4/4815_TR2410_c0_g1~~gnl/Spiro4/4815_TR2410_c0_g1_i1.p2  ORF type:complete len:145 (+),score=36.37 gnl/Spiro4/4815_TR2410_c0_g1_i1:79-513(+)